MCTAMSKTLDLVSPSSPPSPSSPSPTNLFGRTMDFSYPLQPQFFVATRDYHWTNPLTKRSVANRHAFIAIGQQADGRLSFFDGVNEHGLAVAALYFADWVKYIPMDDALSSNQTLPLASTDFVTFVLGRCESIEGLLRCLKSISIVGVANSITNDIAPLHWMVCDRLGRCIVIEPTQQGLTWTENPLGVLANSPDIGWQLTNLRNYRSLSVFQEPEIAWEGVGLRPFGQGGGSVGLPGGYTSPERFVRTAFLKSHTIFSQELEKAVMSWFHVMDSVSIPMGVVITNRDTADFTLYTAVMDTRTCTYYFHTYDNRCIRSLGLNDVLTGGVDVQRVPNGLLRLGSLDDVSILC